MDTSPQLLSQIPTALVWQILDTVMDPETHLSIVAMGLVYSVEVQSETTTHPDRIYITYTLTTPLCPLARVIDEKIRSAMSMAFPHLDLDKNTLVLELVFEPVWTLARLTPEAKAELGF